MNSKCIRVGLFQTNCYIVEDGSFYAVIDPGDEFDTIEQNLTKEPTHIIITHAHFDHVGALKQLHTKYPNALIAIGEHEELNPETTVQEAKYVLGSAFYMAGFGKTDLQMPKPDILLKDGDTIGPFEVLFTPGHSFGSICLLNSKDKIMFSGDTLFRHNHGRTDINGSYELIIKSLKRLLKLDGQIKVYPGHEGPTSIGEEKIFFNF